MLGTDLDSRGEDRFGTLPQTDEWDNFRHNVVDLRHKLERTLRRELVHDARSARARLQNESVRDLADEALCEVLDDWRSKPGGTPPYQWMLKRGLHLLDAALDREALAAESRQEERAVELELVVHDLAQEDDERARWVEMAGMLIPNSDGVSDYAPVAPEPEPFDGLPSAPEKSSPESQLTQAETIQALEDALRGLPETRRRAVSLRYLDELETEDVAFLLEMSPEQAELEIDLGLRALRIDLAAR